MSDWPAPDEDFNDVCIASWNTLLGAGAFMASTGGYNAGGSQAWGTANLARFYPFIVPTPIVVTTMYWVNGATLGGNCDAGVYDRAGNRLGGTGSVAQAGTTAFQKANVAANFTLLPGVYYMGLNNSTTTAIFGAIGGSALTAAHVRGAGCYQVASAVPMGNTVTFAAAAFTRWTQFGLSAITAI